MVFINLPSDVPSGAVTPPQPLCMDSKHSCRRSPSIASHGDSFYGTIPACLCFPSLSSDSKNKCVRFLRMINTWCNGAIATAHDILNENMHRHNVSIDIAIASLDISHELLVSSTPYLASKASTSVVEYSNVCQNPVACPISSPTCKFGLQGETDVEKSQNRELKQGPVISDGLEVQQASLNMSNAEKVPPEHAQNTTEAPLRDGVTCALSAHQGDDAALSNKKGGFRDVPVIEIIRKRVSGQAKPLVSMVSESVKLVGNRHFGTRRLKFSSRPYVSRVCTEGTCIHGTSRGWEVKVDHR